MKYLLASTLAMSVAAIAAMTGTATAGTTAAGDSATMQCAIGYVTGVGGSAQSLRDYLATPDRDKFRYLKDNEIHCRISDEGRATACTGVTNLSNEKVSVYDDIDSATMAVVARVELDEGTYPVIIAVQRKDVRCQE